MLFGYSRPAHLLDEICLLVMWAGFWISKPGTIWYNVPGIKWPWALYAVVDRWARGRINIFGENMIGKNNDSGTPNDRRAKVDMFLTTLLELCQFSTMMVISVIQATEEGTIRTVGMVRRNHCPYFRTNNQ